MKFKQPKLASGGFGKSTRPIKKINAFSAPPKYTEIVATPSRTELLSYKDLYAINEDLYAINEVMLNTNIYEVSEHTYYCKKAKEEAPSVLDSPATLSQKLLSDMYAK